MNYRINYRDLFDGAFSGERVCTFQAYDEELNPILAEVPVPVGLIDKTNKTIRPNKLKFNNTHVLVSINIAGSGQIEDFRIPPDGLSNII